MSTNARDETGSKPEGENISRRRFLGYLIGGIGGVIGAALAVPLVGYFLSPVWKKNAPLLTPIARTSDIPVGKPTFITYEQRIRDGWYISTLSKGAWIVNQDNNRFIVYDPKCTHLNCPYYWNNDRQIFQCPCHGAEFDINGNVLAGPPPRPLDRLEFTIQEGSILLSGKIIGKGT